VRTSWQGVRASRPTAGTGRTRAPRHRAQFLTHTRAEGPALARERPRLALIAQRSEFCGFAYPFAIPALAFAHRGEAPLYLGHELRAAQVVRPSRIETVTVPWPDGGPNALVAFRPAKRSVRPDDPRFVSGMGVRRPPSFGVVSVGAAYGTEGLGFASLRAS